MVKQSKVERGSALVKKATGSSGDSVVQLVKPRCVCQHGEVCDVSRCGLPGRPQQGCQRRYEQAHQPTLNKVVN